MSPLASELFRTVTSAKAEVVWDALTATESPLGYLYGMTAESDWQPGATLTMTLDNQWRLIGDVLVAERPRRLSYTLGDRPGEPEVYVSWSCASSTTRRSSASTSTNHGRRPTSPTTSRPPGFRRFPAWSRASAGAHLRGPQQTLQQTPQPTRKRYE
jgi:uncharacterized protein YndB with AHSA1/START domain